MREVITAIVLSAAVLAAVTFVRPASCETVRLGEALLLARC